MFCTKESALIEQRKIYRAPRKTDIVYWYHVNGRRKRKKRLVSDLAPKRQAFGGQKYCVIHPKYV